MDGRPGTCVGREALEANVRQLQSHLDGMILAKAAPVYQTREFGYLAWTLWPEDGDPVKTGFDAAIVCKDLIADFYTVITNGVPVLPSSTANGVDSECTGLDGGS
jgi:hypothetical protein